MLLFIQTNKGGIFSLKNDNTGANCVKELYGKGNLSQIADYLSEIFDKGNVAVICDENSFSTAERACRYLGDGGYFVRQIVAGKFEFGLPDTDECVRYYVGVGNTDVADVTKLLAKRAGVGFSLVPTAPDSERYVEGGVYYMHEFIGTELPDMLLIDSEIIEKAPCEATAAGYGRVFSQLVTIFDRDVGKLMFAKSYDEEALQTLSESIREFESEKTGDEFRSCLMHTLIKIGLAREKLNVRYEGTDEVARVMAKVTGKSFGEASFISAYMILNVYRCYLADENVDTLIPEDIVFTIKTLEKMKVVNYNKYMSEIEVTRVDDYLKQTFILNEYRREMFEKLDGLDLAGFARFWRRLYDDAGYWLKRFSSGKELLKILSLASELGSDGLLKYVKRTGFFERLI